MGFLGIFIFILSVLAYLRKKHTKLQETVEQNFWERENRANATRRRDISGLPYITIPLERFPIGICKDEAAITCETTLTSLSDKKILNLGNQTNTDLKLQYGAGNLTELTECEQRFTILCRTLITYAETLIAAGYRSEAITVLEFGISCGSDLSKNYLLLADLYLETGASAKLADLAEKAAALECPLKDAIVRQLKEKMNA